MEFSSEQLNISQRLQQQRIFELQMAQQRQLELMTQSQSQFTAMRDRFLAATTVAGGAISRSDLTMFGRQVTTFGAAPARQSLLGAYLDATVPQGGLLGLLAPRAGFQFGSPTALIQQRAADRLGVMNAQVGNVALDALLPMFLQHRLRRVGFGNIAEDSAMTRDMVAGIRNGADTISGLGIRDTTAADAQRQFLSRINNRYKGKLDEDEIRSLQVAGLSLADTRQLGTAVRSGSGELAALMDKQVKLLETVARNTGISYKELGKLVQRTTALGNDGSNLASAANTVNSLQADQAVNREQQLETALNLTAQGRQLNAANADRFAKNQLRKIDALVDGFNKGNIDRAELFRFGGANSWEAAERVNRQMIAQGVNFTQANIATLGVLGTNAFAAQAGGVLGTQSAIAGTLLGDPYAGVRARFNYTTNQFMTQNADVLALMSARNVARLRPGMDRVAETDPSFIANIKDVFGASQNLPDLEAGRQVDILLKNETKINDRLRGLGITDTTKRARVLSVLNDVGLGGPVANKLLEDADFLENVASGSAHKAYIDREVGLAATTQRELESHLDMLLSSMSEADKIKYLGVPYFTAGKTVAQRIMGEAGYYKTPNKSGIRAASTSDFFETRNKDLLFSGLVNATLDGNTSMTVDDLARLIDEQDRSDGTADYGGFDTIVDDLRNNKMSGALKLTERQRAYVAQQMLRKVTLNLEQATIHDGSAADKYLYVKVVDK